jgi:large-conductance mechanosensitive channel
LYLILSIFLASILGLVLFISGPWVGGILAFGIIAGCLFRGIYLLNDIHRRVSKEMPKTDKAQEVYENYLREKEEHGQR